MKSTTVNSAKKGAKVGTSSQRMFSRPSKSSSKNSIISASSRTPGNPQMKYEDLKLEEASVAAVETVSLSDPINLSGVALSRNLNQVSNNF